MDVTSALKEKLQNIRNQVKDELQKLSPLIEELDCQIERLSSERNKRTMLRFTERVQWLSQRCNDRMVEFAGDVIHQATEICGSPPCQFVAVGIGSMAKGEATPYSDLEFLFLVENEDFVSYFEELAVTAYFIIGNLQETKLKYMDIEELNRDHTWFEDTSVSGFKIDGLQKNAGNIPTGNGTQSQKNKFIQTVDGLVDMYAQIFILPDPEKSKIGDMSAMLSSTVLLCGESHLYDEFLTRISAIERSALRREASIKMLWSDAMKFDYRPDDTLTHIKDVKKDFYRFPSIIIFDLKIIHGVRASSVWETIDCLITREILSLSIGHSLRVALSISLFARLSVYCHHSSQDDRMTILEPLRWLKGAPWTFPRKLLIHYFLHCAPLKITESNVARPCLVEHGANELILIWTLYKCEDYSAVIACVEEMEGRYDKNWRIMHWYTYSLIRIGEYDKSLEVLMRASTAKETSDYKSSQWFLMGCAYMEKGDYSSALHYHQKSLDIRLKIHGDSPHPDIGSSYSNIGIVYQSQGDYSSALHYHQKSFRLLQSSNLPKTHPVYAKISSRLEHALAKYSQSQQ